MQPHRRGTPQPEHGAAPLNRLHLRRGRMPLPGRRDEALASERFAEANALAPGDTMGALVNGRWERLVLVGIALSPEYVYAVQGGAFLTDSRRFGVLWMDREALAAAFDMRGAFNDVALGLAPGAAEREVIARVDRVLGRYGGLGAYGRRDPELLRQSAHFLRSGSLALGLNALAARASSTAAMRGRTTRSSRVNHGATRSRKCTKDAPARSPRALPDSTRAPIARPASSTVRQSAKPRSTPSMSLRRSHRLTWSTARVRVA